MPRPKTGGGTRKGVPNKDKQILRDRMAKLGCDPFEVLALVSMNDLECGVCRGTGKTKFQPGKSMRFSGERTCQSCWGSGKERIDPKDRARASAELAKYLEPQLKAVEHSNPDGSMKPVGWVMVVKDSNGNIVDSKP